MVISVSTDPDKLDRAQIHRWLSEESYWAAGRRRDVQDAAIHGSLNYGAYEHGQQVGYARVVTDSATFAWLCDVFVDASVRGRGVGRQLVEALLADLDALGVYRALLFTSDAHPFYARYGFAPLQDPARILVRGRS